jgi:hypothetical protein
MENAKRTKSLRCIQREGTAIVALNCRRFNGLT